VCAAVGSVQETAVHLCIIIGYRAVLASENFFCERETLCGGGGAETGELESAVSLSADVDRCTHGPNRAQNYGITKNTDTANEIIIIKLLHHYLL